MHQNLVSSQQVSIHLPVQFFSCSAAPSESQWRNVASAVYLSDQAIDTFWLEAELFKDAEGNNCFEELVLAAIKLLSIAVSNAHLVKAFCQVDLLKDETRNYTEITTHGCVIWVKQKQIDICNL